MGLRTELDGPVLVLVLDRPEVRNAVDRALAASLGDALDAAAANDGVAAVVLTGAGEAAFCAGADLKAAATGELPVAPNGGFAGITGRRFDKPLLAAVNGAALGGGFEIVLCCDLVVAAEHATFGLPEVGLGTIASGGGLLRLARRLPPPLALEIVLTGERLSAERAAAIGLVNRVVPAARLQAETMALAQRIAANAPVAVRASKRLILETPDLGWEDAWAANRQTRAEVWATDDAAEGRRAFAEGRPPRWQGR